MPFDFRTSGLPDSWTAAFRLKAIVLCGLAATVSAADAWAAIPPAAEQRFANGLPTGPIEKLKGLTILVEDRPVVQRCSLRGVGTRALAVGLPGGVNFAFDAGSCRLALAWRGDFLDMSAVWGGRYGGWYAKPVNQPWFAVSTAGVSPPLAAWTSSAPAVPCPVRVGTPAAPSVVTFRGYELVRGVPEFAFEVDGVGVRQRIEAAPGDGLILHFTASATTRPVLLLAPESTVKLRITTDGGRWEGGVLQIEPGKAPRFSMTIVPEAVP